MVLCRICLVKDVRMYSIVDSPLQDIYENLTMMPLQDNTRPTSICYMCHGRLQNCYKLKLMCLQSEQWFNQQISGNEIQSNTYIPRMQLTYHTLTKLGNRPETELNLAIVKREPVELTEGLKQEIIEENSPEDETENTTDNILSKIKPESIDQILVEKNQINKNDLKRTKNKLKNGEKELIYKCDKCDKCYSSSYSLKRHKRTSVHTVKKRDICANSCSIIHNSNEKLYQCELCEKKFSMKGNLLTHIRTHSGERPYECDICEKCFALEKNLKRHYRIHTGEKPFQCIVCKQRFAVKYNLNVHLRRKHTGERPFKCGNVLCDKSFYVKSEMLNHMVIHTTNHHYKRDGDTEKRRDGMIQQYKCDICKKILSSKSIFLRHIRAHSGEKQYQCEICNKSFGRNSDLVLHYRVHTGEKSYQCDICKLCFVYKSNLRTHIKRYHLKKI